MRRFLVAWLLLGLSACASVSPASKAVSAGPPPASYIAQSHLDATAYLDPPPAAGSLAETADLAAVRAAQALKGQPRWALAQSDDDIDPFNAFASVLGPNFSKAKAPKTAALFDVLFADVKSLTGPAKEAYGRPRPPLVDKTLETCKPLEKSKSYPSGHSTRGWMMALVLSDMAPEKANALLARGRDYGDSRVVCAEHYPSDVEAGRMVGASIFAAAKADPRFVADFQAAKVELRAALGL